MTIPATPRRRNRPPEGVLYRRGLTSLAAGSFLMTMGISSGAHDTGAPVSVAAGAFAALAIAAAFAAMYMTAYTLTVPSLLRARYSYRHGSLAGWNGHREAADAWAGERARTGLGRLLVRVRNGTWN